MSTEAEERFQDVYEPRRDEYDTLQNNHLIEQVIGQITPTVTELEGFLPTLPTVKPDGRSDCPFAREMFRKKDALEAKLRDKLTVLRDMETAMHREIARCKRNLQRIGGDARRVVSDAVKGKYRKAETLQEEEYQEAMVTQKQLDRVIVRVDATIAASRRKVFPGGISDQGADAHMPASATTELPGSSSEGRMRDEVDGLLALDHM